MMNWLETLMLFRLMIEGTQLKIGRYDAKIAEIEKKTPPKHDNNLTTLKFNNLTEENFAERFRQEKLATDDDFNTAEQQALKTEAKKKLKTSQITDFNLFYWRSFLVMMVLKLCLFITQHLAYYS